MAQFGGPKLVKKLHFDQEAKNKLVKGIKSPATSISVTVR